MSLPKHDGQIYYEAGRAWTPERIGQFTLVWKRVPEKDARPDKRVERMEGG